MRSPDPYPVEVVRQLWPGHPDPVVVHRPGRRPTGTTQWWVLPSPGRARLLVPVGNPSAAVMLKRHGGGVKRVGRSLLEGAVRARVLDLLPVSRLQVASDAADGVASASAGSVDNLLVHVLGQPVSTGLILGTPRANRKPVLQVFADDGSTAAFVKVGTDDSSRPLVRREAECLRDVHAAGLKVVKPPQVLYAGPLGELELLVLSPLISSQAAGRQPGAPPPLEAMAELASARTVTSESLSDSSFWKDVGSAVGTLADPDRARVAEIVNGVEAAHGSTQVVMGSWHGDWAPWNMGLSGGYVEVWDWERFASPVPWGLDAVHYLAQRVRHGAVEVAAQEQVLLEQLPTALREMEPHGPQQDPLLMVLCYLVTIGLRFGPRTPTGDETADRPARPHPRGVWALDLAERLLDSVASGAGSAG